MSGSLDVIMNDVRGPKGVDESLVSEIPEKSLKAMEKLLKQHQPVYSDYVNTAYLAVAEYLATGEGTTVYVETTLTTNSASLKMPEYYRLGVEFIPMMIDDSMNPEFTAKFLYYFGAGVYRNFIGIVFEQGNWVNINLDMHWNLS